MKNKALIGVFAAVAAALVIIIVLVAKNAGAPAPEATPAPTVEATATPDTTAQPDNTAEVQNQIASTAAPEQKEEEKVYKPTFMYFISGKDEGFDATNVMLEELKKEYGDKVNFDIRNIDENPELVNNFPVGDGNTPTLIMLNTKNEISNILFKNKNKNELKAAIDAAMK